ncbi:MAG: GTP-binding protein [Agathobaculum sp.]|jgi:putative membrane protein|uniref:TIGR03943 family putative permease subunit n=1 Tax=Agathobaculum sp. TaxID=2048138 RepID=UPI003D8F6543
MERIPVYVFTGFLESGKTSFIREILSDPNFTEDEISLLIQCEEGIEEFDEDELKQYRTVLEVIDDPKRLTPNVLKRLEQKCRPDRILIELNGMWSLETAVNAFPARWELCQIVTTVDAGTFALYSQNLGPMMFEHISTADLVVFNRCTDELKQMLYDKSINAMNPRATIYLDDVDGNSEDYARHLPLPFDIDADVIDIGAEDYGLWYLDATSEPEKYRGKTVRFLAQVYNGSNVPAGSFVPGRFGMVCCAEDISFLGFVCRYPAAGQLKMRDWVRVTASITVEELPEYRGEGPVLHAIEVVPAEKPADDLVYFNR